MVFAGKQLPEVIHHRMAWKSPELFNGFQRVEQIQNLVTTTLYAPAFLFSNYQSLAGFLQYTPTFGPQLAGAVVLVVDGPG